MRPRVSEIRKIVSLLDEPSDDVETLAERVLSEAISMIESRDTWCVVMLDDRLGMFLFGPYETEAKARKAIGTTIVSSGPTPARAVVKRVLREKE
jgi:hypothetical protein